MFALGDLERIIAERAGASDEKSYTAGLLKRGTPHCARKMGEEAIETVIAATTADRGGLRSESADLLYHLLVLLHSAGIPLQEVMQELEKRTNMSGLEEKASRSPGGK